MKKLRMSVGWWMPHYEKLRMSVGWWMPHYKEVKGVSRLVDATL